eukprot:INCI19695.1.p1 GENE.INCI19695.1~~INCI19695.1.p1  ORF type:complete len:473 (-),score=66.33 INCI19695.1:406-1824(-)
MLHRNLSSLPIPPKYRSKLDDGGYKTVRDISDVRPLELARDLEISPQEGLDLWRLAVGTGASPLVSTAAASTPSKAVSSGSFSKVLAMQQKTIHKKTSRSHTALDMFAKGRSSRGVVSFCRSLDKLVGGGHGFPCGEITEICGQPGIGKTQLAIQVAVDALIPRAFGGVGGSAVYIDTEGSFVVERVRQMAKALVADLHRKLGNCRSSVGSGGGASPDGSQGRSTDSSSSPASSASPAAKSTKGAYEERAAALHSLTVDHILRNIHYFRVYNHSEQLGLINCLDKFLVAHPSVKVVVVDSISAHFRRRFDDMALRTRLLAGMGQKLHLCANHHAVAIVLTNQVTTKVLRGGGSTLVPALGTSWGHTCTNRLLLQWAGHHHGSYENAGVRVARLTKSATRRPGEALFRVVAAGVRDIDAITPAIADIDTASYGKNGPNGRSISDGRIQEGNGSGSRPVSDGAISKKPRVEDSQ